MKTVVENREGLNVVKGLKVNRTDQGFIAERDDALASRSCFYDFGAKQRAAFSESPFELESDFVEKMMERLLKR